VNTPKKIGVKVETLTNTGNWTNCTQTEKDGVAKVEAELQDIELKKKWLDKAVKGDASETGLLKFIVPLMLAEF